MNLSNEHILVMTSVYPLTEDGNHGAFIRELILRLKPTGAKFTVFAPAYEGSSGYILDDIVVYRFRYFLRSWENLVRDGAPTKLQRQPLYVIPALCYILLGSIQLFWVCLTEKPTMIHVHWPFPHGLMAWWVCQLLKIPMIFTFYGAELLLAKRFGLVGTILRGIIPEAKAVTAISSFTKRLVEEVSDGSIEVIPYGLTVEAKPSISRNPDEVPRLLFVGRLDERKGLSYLLQALPLVLAQREVELRIVGKGILESDLKTESVELKVDGVVKFLGFLTKEELALEYAGCDIFVLPAIVDRKGDTEGLGIVLIEALVHGKPVIASNVGGIAEIVIHEQTGLLVDEKNPLALARAILDLLSNPEKGVRLGQEGFSYIQEKFNWDRIIELWNVVLAKSNVD